MGLSDLQNRVLEDLALDMSKSFDFVILCDAMVNCGWTVIEVDYYPDAGQTWYTVVNWADENFEGQYQEHKGKWLIENSKDATMFALKWKVKQ